MTRVTKNKQTINLVGHAEDKIVCAMITSQTVGLVKNITERLGEDPDFILRPGFFSIDTTGLSEEALILVEAFMYSMNGIAGSYPKYVQYLA